MAKFKGVLTQDIKVVWLILKNKRKLKTLMPQEKEFQPFKIVTVTYNGYVN